MNSTVVSLIHETVDIRLDNDPKYQEVLAEFNNAIAKLHAKGISLTDLRVVENAFFEGQRQMFDALLPFAFELGRDPSAIFDLPDTE